MTTQEIKDRKDEIAGRRLNRVMDEVRWFAKKHPEYSKRLFTKITTLYSEQLMEGFKEECKELVNVQPIKSDVYEAFEQSLKKEKSNG